jgi:divalent metal cation (Fe/Co/Zn/Cd) transporter
MSKKTVLLIMYVLSVMFFLRSVFRIIINEGTGGYGMMIVSALVMTFLLRIYLKERRKEKKRKKKSLNQYPNN